MLIGAASTTSTDGPVRIGNVTTSERKPASFFTAKQDGAHGEV